MNDLYLPSVSLWSIKASGTNQCQKQMKKKKNSNWYEAKQLFTSFTKEMILSLPKLLSLTDLYESFVMWLTVQELLLGIVVYLSFVKSK